MDLAINQEFVKTLLSELLDVTKRFYKVLLGTVGKYIQVMWAGDDLGHQGGLLSDVHLSEKFLF